MQSLKGGGQIRPQLTMNHPSQEPDKRRLFRIGEVAAMFHVSVGTLRHYEKEGLLAPAYTDPRSGYRYYGAREFETLNTIRYLRCLDMPLETIADFLQNRDPAVMEEKLRQQKACLAQKRRALDIMARKIDHRLSALSGARLAPPGEASNELCRLVVLNTASIQLLPTTIAAIRAAEGAVSPFDILPAVWISSAVSVAVGLAAACAMERRP